MTTVFHGTRAYFRSGIQNGGLGAECLVERFRVAKFLQEGLTVLCEGSMDAWRSNDSTRHPVIDDFYFIKRAAMQADVSNFNFSHRHPWFSTNKLDAAAYAKGVPEVLRFGFGLFDALNAANLVASVRERVFIEHWIPLRADLEHSEPLVLGVEMEELPLGNWYRPNGTPLGAWPRPQPFRRIPQQESYEYRGVIPDDKLTF